MSFADFFRLLKHPETVPFERLRSVVSPSQINARDEPVDLWDQLESLTLEISD